MKGQMGVCKLCGLKTDKDFCDPCILTLEKFDSSYRNGTKLTTVEGLEKLVKEGTYARL